MRVLMPLLLIATMIASSGVRAEEGTSIGEMMEYCQKPDGNPFRIHCHSYVAGVIDIQSIYALADAGGLKSVCFPPQLVSRQAAAVFVLWAGRHPEKHHLPAASGIVDSLVEAFPCKAA